MVYYLYYLLCKKISKCETARKKKNDCVVAEPFFTVVRPVKVDHTLLWVMNTCRV